MRPDNKKAGSGQATGKNEHLLGANNGRCSQIKYTTRPDNNKPFDVDAHLRAARRAMVDAYYLFKDWPSKIRYSYFVGPDGKLLCRSERKGAI